LHITIYRSVHHGKCIYFKKDVHSYGEQYKQKVTLAIVQKSWFVALKPNILLLHFCATCSTWRKGKNLTSFIDEHINSCRRCDCGFTYTLGDAHNLICRKERAQKKARLQAKKYIAETGEESELFLNNHHADFECHREGKDHKFIFNTAVLLPHGDPKPSIKIGRTAMEWFMDEIQKLSGVLWFFNGGRFDLYMVLEYCILHNITIDNDNSIISTNQVYTLALYTRPPGSTKIQTLVIKDLARFCPGSLDFNCENLGLESSSCKGTFDHSKIKTWDDVERHAVELSEYAILDVIAQSRVYEETAKALWRDYKLNMSKFISLAQFSYAASTIFMPPNVLFKVGHEDFFGNPVNYEQSLRSAYRGGRIVATLPYWKHNDYDLLIHHIQQGSLGIDEKHFDSSIRNYKKYYDVVSLYPSQMWSQKFPCGKMKYNKYNPLRNGLFIKQINAEAEIMRKAIVTLSSDDGQPPFKHASKPKVDNLFWRYCVIRIDIDPPEEIQYISFLMDRDEKGNNTQNFKPKRHYWTTGVELLEAIILGYKLIHVYDYFSWEKVEYLFKEFISKSILRKSQSRKGTAGYLIPKNIMNSNSGKWAQRLVKTVHKLLIGSAMEQDSQLKAESVNFIYSEYGEVLAKVVKQKNEATTSPYPLHMSVFILAYSRERMSNFTRAIKGYTNPTYVPTYGDTDSIFVDSESVKQVDKIEFGKNLGQMDDEKPGCYIIASIVLAPKTYMILWVKFATQHGPLAENGKELHSIPNLWVKFTSKGIPHTRDDYDPFGDYSVSPETAEMVEDIINFQENRTTTKNKYPNVELKKYYFYKVYQDSERECEIKDRLTWTDMEDLIHEKASILSIFGGMVRNLISLSDVNDMGVNMDYQRRSIVNQPWWKKGHRVVNAMTYPYEITKPNR